MAPRRDEISKLAIDKLLAIAAPRVPKSRRLTAIHEKRQPK